MSGGIGINPEIRTRQCRFPTINLARKKRHCRILACHFGAAGIDISHNQETALPFPPLPI
jgi:hypothetical protein